MLLFGFLLLSTILAEEQEFTGLRIQMCMQEGKVKSLGARNHNETLNIDCRDLGDSYWDALLILGKRNITSVENGWYHLQHYGFHTIYLDHNKIDEIPKEMLNDLPAALKRVSLAHNQIKRLEKEIIKNNYITKLDFSNNAIDDIESEALSNVPRLRHLGLQHNRLTNTEFAATLPPRLTEIHLTNNAITEILVGSFSNLGRLRKLWLDDNKITAISEQSFKGLIDLTHLMVRNNPIREVETGSFSKLVELQEMSLSYIYHCYNTSAIPDREFDRVSNLLPNPKHFDLSYNYRQAVESSSFHSNP